MPVSLHEQHMYMNVYNTKFGEAVKDFPLEIASYKALNETLENYLMVNKHDLLGDEAWEFIKWIEKRTCFKEFPKGKFSFV
jgi:hypothetical protein